MSYHSRRWDEGKLEHERSRTTCSGKGIHFRKRYNAIMLWLEKNKKINPLYIYAVRQEIRRKAND
jgi:hypothetical protein